jgi:predicted metal-binding membrane protein
MGTSTDARFEDWPHQRLLRLTGIVPLRIAASTRLIGPPGVWAARHPEWWPLAISLAAWLNLVFGVPDNGMSLCTSAPPSPFMGAFFGWMSMTLAMMPPLVVLSVRHVGFRSLRDRRHTAIAEFLAGYLGIWLATGTVLAVVLFATDTIPFGTDRRIVAIPAYGAAILWQLTPFKRRALWRCHRTVPLAIESWRADLSCLRFGVGAGLDCLSSCWLLMALPLLTPHSLAVMACVQAAMVCDRYQRARYPRRAPSILLIGAAFLVDVCQGLA